LSQSSSATLDARLAEIDQLDLPNLQAIWARRFGRPPPKGLSRRLLELAAAYDAQERVHGGLKPALQRKLLRSVPDVPEPDVSAPRRSRTSAPPPGSRLVREWGGRTHTIEVSDSGFIYAGQRYRSLSEIARTITGTRWSGPRFFGL
jgi:DUF2924 family protein